MQTIAKIQTTFAIQFIFQPQTRFKGRGSIQEKILQMYARIEGEAIIKTVFGMSISLCQIGVTAIVPNLLPSCVGVARICRFRRKKNIKYVVVNVPIV